MEYIHVKNLKKYHPGYHDRDLIWCKVYFSIMNGEPELEMMCEIDQWRFVKFAMLELQVRNPVPLDISYLSRKGFNDKVRPISETIKMLHNFLTICNAPVTPDEENPCIEVEKKDIEVEKNKYIQDFLSYFNQKNGKSLKLTPERNRIIKARLENHTIEDLKKAVDNFVLDDWSERHKFCDIVYCIGIRNKVDNLDKWMNAKQKKTRQTKNLVIVYESKCTLCAGTGVVNNGNRKGEKCVCGTGKYI